MERENLKIVIVGHVDHGKSTLIGRLFFDTDSLPEEKKKEIENICKGKNLEFAFVMDQLKEEQDQGITIDTTQTFFKTKKRDYTIIDAPGHKEFLKNMITGASQAEVAILIVDAKEGIQEQSKRHAYLLSFLGIKQIIVVINKMDLMDYKKDVFENIKKELLIFLEKINLEPTYIIPISGKEGDNIANTSKNINWYNEKTVLESLDTFKKEKTEEKELRMPVQDVYKVNDKRIIVGRVESGSINKDEKIIFLPSKKETTVKSIEVFEKEKTIAKTGESIGIIATGHLFIERGEVICNKYMEERTKFKAELFWMDKNPINTNQELILRCSTQETTCTIKKIIKKMNSSTLEIINENTNILKETEVGELIIETKKPIMIEKFNNIPELGRFVLVRNNNTSAGGIVTNF